MFRGTFTALVTPFRADGTLDEKGFGHLVRRQLAAGIDGVALFTEAAEPQSLSLDERRRLVEIVHECTEGHLFVWAAVEAGGAGDSDRLAREMDWLGVDALLVSLPEDTSDARVRIREIAGEVETPLFVRASASIEPAELANVCELDAVRGVVDTTRDLGFAKTALTSWNEELTFFAGDDARTAATLALGARGVLSVLANFVPASMNALVDAALQGRTEEADRRQRELDALVEAHRLAPSPVVVKAALEWMGLVSSRHRAPFAGLGASARGRLFQALARLGVDPTSSTGLFTSLQGRRS